MKNQFSIVLCGIICGIFAGIYHFVNIFIYICVTIIILCLFFIHNLNVRLFLCGFCIGLIRIFIFLCMMHDNDLQSGYVSGQIISKSPHWIIHDNEWKVNKWKYILQLNFVNCKKKIAPVQKIKVITYLNENLHINELIQGNAQFYSTFYPLSRYDIDTSRLLHNIVAYAHFDSYDVTNTQQPKILKDIYDQFEYDVASILQSLLFGDSSNISPKVRLNFSQSSLSHLLAVSGLHISIIGGLFYGLARWIIPFFAPNIAITCPLQILGFISGAVGITLYMNFIVVGIPILRAVIMFILAMLGMFYFISSTIYYAMAIILMIWPTSLLNISFQLSFAAVFGLFINTSPVIYEKTKLFGKFGECILNGILTTFKATVATLPYSIYWFGTASLQPFTSNFIAIPLLSVMIMPLLLIWITFNNFGYGTVISPILSYTIQQLLFIANYFANQITWFVNAKLSTLSIILWSFGLFFSKVDKKVSIFFVLMFICSVLMPAQKQAMVLLFKNTIAIYQNDEIYTNNANPFIVNQWSRMLRAKRVRLLPMQKMYNWRNFVINFFRVIYDKQEVLTKSEICEKPHILYENGQVENFTDYTIF